jgi:hypothetical protein
MYQFQGFTNIGFSSLPVLIRSEAGALERERFLLEFFVCLPALFSTVHQRHVVKEFNGLSPSFPSFSHSSQYSVSQLII